MTLTVAVERLPHAADLPLPAYATEDSAGLDLVAAIAGPVTLVPGARDRRDHHLGDAHAALDGEALAA